MLGGKSNPLNIPKEKPCPGCGTPYTNEQARRSCMESHQKTIKAVLVVTPADCINRTCDCEPGTCRFPDCETCDNPTPRCECKV